MSTHRRKFTPSATIEVASATSIAMLAPLLVALDGDEQAELRPLGALPSPVCHVTSASVILAATPIVQPAFYRKRMTAASSAHDADVILVRHGFHPEVLDEVVYDVVVRTRHRPTGLWDRHLFRHADGGLWLVPSRPAPGGGDLFVQLCPDGLRVTRYAPHVGADDRSEGVMRAARETVLAQRSRRRR